MFDLILAGGAVVDGTGRAAIRADVGIRGERIAAIGDLAQADAGRVIDATGLTVAPGFIDTHTHAEGALLVDPQHANGLRQGVTTVLLGIDGMSYAPLSRENYKLYRQWLSGLLGDPPEELDMSSVAAFRAHYHRKVAVNTAYLVPHATVRLEVLGFHDRPLVGEPLARAKRLVREGLEQGAVGFTTGSKYYPGPWADTRELVELCSVVREAGKVYMSEPRATPRAFAGGGPAEAMEIVRQSGVKLHLAHWRTGADSAGRIEAIMGPIDAARRDEDDVTFDIYPYPSGSSIPVSFLPGEVQEGGPEAILQRLADPTVRGRVGAWLDAHQSLYLTPMTFSYAPDAPELEGARLVDLADARRRSPGETLCELLLEQRLRLGHVTAPPESEAVRERIARDCMELLARPDYMVCSDITPAGGCTHPRCYGTFPRLLGRYRRDYGTMPLEAMVHRMTDRPARRFGLTGRGRIETGYFADIVVFDAATVNDTGTYARPRAFPVGIPYVIVNGEIAVDQERCTGVYAGQAVP
ncbi:amidohydrolase family protein [Alsobacter sp. SYSU M60028]|uniref:Amidohydrolase family protein n=1 Tax=Alsobacter ponti TaxID=2962936 RepID=A0ABT1L7K7_9HYPH|nr:amidohydrolase family protein [Alsobacter ponti]MCP8937471.1 amidohydrolase family protein [Alsobacter ponti]